MLSPLAGKGGLREVSLSSLEAEKQFKQFISASQGSANPNHFFSDLGHQSRALRISASGRKNGQRRQEREAGETDPISTSIPAAETANQMTASHSPPNPYRMF